MRKGTYLVIGLIVSLLANVAFISITGIVVARRGGMSWVAAKLSRVHDGPSPSATDARASLFEVLPNTAGDIYMVGDSITSQCEWAELLGNCRLCNRAIAGDTTSGVLARVDEITEGKPAKVFLMVGINDVHGKGEVADIVGRYRQIVERIAADCPDTRIYVQSILPINERLYRRYTASRYPGIHIPTRSEVKVLNACIREMAGGNVFYVDLWPVLTRDGQLRAEYTFDGLHVNGDGYVAWAAAIGPLVQE